MASAARAARRALLGRNPRARSLVDALPSLHYERPPPPQASSAEALAGLPELALTGRRAARQPNIFAGLPLDSAEAAAALPTVVAGGEPVNRTQFAELPNGARVAGVDRHGLCASLGLFVHCGSRYGTEEEACLPHFLELMAFRSSAHLSHQRTLKTLEQLGAGMSCRVGREDVLYQVDTLREYVPVLLPLMLANVLCPEVLEAEVEEAREQVPEVHKHLEENTETLLAELLHVAAYGGNTLGYPLYAQEEDLPKLTTGALRNFLRQQCTPDRLIVVGVNADFDELCEWTARSFADAGVSAETPRQQRVLAPAQYTGGEQRLQAPNPLCHLMFGWEVPGGWNGPLLAAVTVLQMFLGGGGSFSTGGPGKGMHTRMYTEVLNRHHWVESCQASSVMYEDSGLFTVYATVVPAHAGEFIDVLAKIFKGVSKISDKELQRAKNALKSSIHMNLEMRSVMMEDIGRQLVLSGKVGTAQEFSRMVDAVTVGDLQNALRQCLAKDPTLLAYGAIDSVPLYTIVKERLATAAP